MYSDNDIATERNQQCVTETLRATLSPPGTSVLSDLIRYKDGCFPIKHSRLLLCWGGDYNGPFRGGILAENVGKVRIAPLYEWASFASQPCVTVYGPQT